MRPHAGIEICLQFQAYRKGVCIFLTPLTLRIADTAHRAEQVLNVMSNLMCDYIRNRKITRRTKSRFQFTEKRQVDVELLIGRAIERANCCPGLATCRANAVAEKNKCGLAILLVCLAEDCGPNIF